MALLCLVALLAACGDGSGGGGGGGNAGGNGSGGSGGSGGSAGGNASGGSGGGNVVACDAAQAMVVHDSWPWFGFEDPTPDLATMPQGKVSVLDAFGMDIAFDAGGLPARFTWRGADLAAAFAVGDTVTASFDPNVQSYSVAGLKGTAVAMRYAKSNTPASLPAIPGGGPNLSITTACTLEETKMCPMPELRTLFTLHASLGATETSIESGKQGQVEAWNVFHVKTIHSAFFSAGDCVADTFFDGMVHALYVKP